MSFACLKARAVCACGCQPGLAFGVPAPLVLLPLLHCCFAVVVVPLLALL
jgi:hypothetical protein